MSASSEPESSPGLRELVARFAGQFPEAALVELAGRLLRADPAGSRWAEVLGDVVACAVYNQISLEQAEQLITNR